MQLARLLDGRATRDAQGKARQMLEALALERREGKDRTLEPRGVWLSQNTGGLRAGSEGRLGGRQISMPEFP